MKEVTQSEKNINNFIPPRFMSICKFTTAYYPKELQSQWPMDKRGRFIFFGEIPNMPGHCIVMNMSTKEFHNSWPVHLFVELCDEDDLI